MRCFTIFALVIVAAIASVSSAFVVKSPTHPLSLVRVEAQRNKLLEIATTAAIVFSTSPLAVLAEEAGDYEYGAVSAPIGLAWGAGVLAILTALLPVVLQGGEKAFDEMKDRDSDSWGTGGADPLGKKKR